VLAGWLSAEYRMATKLRPFAYRIGQDSLKISIPFPSVVASAALVTLALQLSTFCYSRSNQLVLEDQLSLLS